MAYQPWRNLLGKALQQSMQSNKDSISYSFATLEQGSGLPKTRFIVHRGFVNERRKEDDPSDNPMDKTADGMLSTTDSRGPKAQQMLAYKEKGCPCEIAWWMEPTKDQFRIQGRAYLYSGPDSPNQNYLPAHLYPFEGFDWEEERLRIFAKMSPPLKASFLRPVPGTALDQTDYDYKKLPQELSDEDHDKEWREKAYKNFSLIVIDPEEVDLVNLGVTPNLRWKWIPAEGHENWKQIPVVP